MIQSIHKLSSKSLRLNHLIFWDLLSSRNSLRRFITLQEIEDIIIKTFHIYEYNQDEQKYKNYFSIFNKYSSFPEFVEKNIIVLNIVDIRNYITSSYGINWKEIGITNKNEDNIDNTAAESNHNDKWHNYTSTINFVNDLIYISEILKIVQSDKRSEVLKSFISYINKNLLPSEVYVPIPFGLGRVNHNSQQVLHIDEEFAFCLSTKDKVPYHILLEIKDDVQCLDNNIEVIPHEDKEEENIKVDNITNASKKDNNSSWWNFMKILTNCTRAPQEDEENENDENIPEHIYSTGFFGKKTFEEVSHSIKKKTKNKNIKIISLIVKGGEDMRQDQFVSQIINLFSTIFVQENLEIVLTPLNIITNGRGGIIQTLTNTTSLQRIKSIEYSSHYSTNNPNSYTHLKNYYKLKFNKNQKNINNSKYKKAISNFMKSLVGYSLLCYFLEIKDRNNGNILIDDEGHIIHIDFGYLLSSSPGNMNFEKAPFKFTMEYVELLNGLESDTFEEFQQLFYKGFLALRRNYLLIIGFVEIYMLNNSDLNCFSNKGDIINNIKNKFALSLNLTKEQKEEDVIKEFTDGLILYALDHWRTKLYDNFQKYCVGIN